MTPTITTLDTTTTVVRTVEHLPVTPDLWAVRWTDTTTRTVRREDKVVAKTTQDKVSERVLTIAQKSIVLKGDAPDFKTHHRLLTPAALEIARQHGYQALAHILEKGVPSADDVAWFDLTSHHVQLAHQDAHRAATQPFTYVAAHGLGDAQVVHVDHGTHVLMRADGVAVPTMHIGEYIGGHFDEAHYDLEKAATHLLGRSDVIVVVHKGYGRQRSPAAQNAMEAILSIPGYNSEPGRRNAIAFRWAPTQQEWDAVQAQATNGHGFCGSEIWKAVFDLDILGLRACGAALFDDFYQAKEAEPDYDD